MTVFLGADHGGFELKNEVKEWLEKDGITVEDCGAHELDDQDDYPQYAYFVATKVLGGETGDKGILVCRSGEGMAMAANRIGGIRAAVVWNEKLAKETRRDNDANVLVLSGDFVTKAAAKDIVKTFLATDFSNEERHLRRINQIDVIGG
jgi:ribose 5-phosphate isomerase B